jgi:multidrug efflux pump subunit AcrA (membrane-fusion protein)
MIASTVGVAWVVMILVDPPKSSSQTTKPVVQPPAPPPAVKIVGPSLLMISKETPLREQLVVIKTKKTPVSFPKMTVTGSVLARVRDGKGTFEDRWQFATHDLSTTYADWVRAKSEVLFAESQYDKTRELAKAETDHLDAVVKRLRPLNQDALVATAQFKQAQADLLKAQIQGEKDVFAAQSNLRTAQKTKSALERDLSQAGIDPGVFGHAVDNMVLVVANVPENRIADVKEQQACEAHFYGYPGKLFPGHVEGFSTTITPDRRMLRVLFELNDDNDLLRPGMYGEVGLGTDKREAILLPPEALLHIGRSDYVIVADDQERWHITEIKLGELHDGLFEVLAGLEAGHDLIAEGAILLKPPAVEALTTQSVAAQP